MAEPEVRVSLVGSVAIVTLNRPKALNSLNINMVEKLYHLYTQWSQPNSGVGCILVQGAGGKAFCAGGDVKSAVLDARAGNTGAPMQFFKCEYNCNLTIAQLPVPYVALIDGIVMGGGVGVSIHGHFRVATERSVFAMPEVGIGLFPDVGASHFLHKLPGYLGRYLALTGARLTGLELKDAGIATHYLPAIALPQVEQRLQQLGPQASDLSQVHRALSELEATSTSSPQSAAQSDLQSFKLPLLNSHFSLGSVREIISSLEQECAAGSGDQRSLEFLKATLSAMKKASPISQLVTWEMLQRGHHKPLKECLEMEFGLVHKFVHGDADFYEGVRATLIDKGTKPNWKYGSVDAVPQAVVDAFFIENPAVTLFDGAVSSRM